MLTVGHEVFNDRVSCFGLKIEFPENFPDLDLSVQVSLDTLYVLLASGVLWFLFSTLHSFLTLKWTFVNLQ